MNLPNNQAPSTSDESAEDGGEESSEESEFITSSEEEEESAPDIPSSTAAFIQHARQTLRLGKYDQSFSYFLCSITSTPSCIPEVREEFTLVTNLLHLSLESQGKREAAFNCFKEAIKADPNNSSLLSDMANYLLKSGLKEESFELFWASISKQPDCPDTQRALSQLSVALVDRWHFRMLNDARRNEAYRSSIFGALEKHSGLAVLDVGTGSGLLSAFAVEGGAGVVYACETSPAQCAVANDLFQSLSSPEAVKLIPKCSRSLVIEHDLPDKVNLLITETFDAALLGEGVLATLHHAWTHLLHIPPSIKTGRVIPSAAILYGAILESKIIRNSLYFVSSDPVISILFGCANTSSTYDCVNLRGMKKHFKLLSRPVKLATFDFNDPISLPSPGTSVISLPSVVASILAPGHAHALVVWFDLRLDESITISSSPYADSCWDQAVFPVDMSWQDSSWLIRGDEVTLDVSLHDDASSVSLTVASVQREGQNLSLNAVNPQCMVQNSGLISKLNDSTLWAQHYAIMRSVFNSGDGQEFTALCIGSGFSLIPFYLASLGARKVSILMSLNERSSLSETSSIYSQTIANIQESHLCCRFKLLTFFKDSDAEDLCGSDCTLILYSDLVLPDGSLDASVFTALSSVSRKLPSSQSFHFLPCSLQIVGQLIESHALMERCRVVDDAKTCGVSIAERFNLFQVPFHYGINFDDAMTFNPLSEPVTLFNLNLACLFRDSLVSKQPFLGAPRLTEVTLPITSTGKIHAVRYWFKLLLNSVEEKETISTESGSLRNNVHVYQSQNSSIEESWPQESFKQTNINGTLVDIPAINSTQMNEPQIAGTQPDSDRVHEVQNDGLQNSLDQMAEITQTASDGIPFGSFIDTSSNENHWAQSALIFTERSEVNRGWSIDLTLTFDRGSIYF